ncbi:MAG: phage holin family protein [Nitrosospira sp.]|nr:phage holin family protein [Nitrosospira sp.]
MFETIRKARQMGAIALERVDDYVELLKISAEIQGQNLKRRVVGYVVIGVFAILSLIFLGLAVIVTCWDTPYRLVAAWGVAAFYALGAFLLYINIPDRADSVSAFDTVRQELQQDIKLMKDIV